MSELEGIVPPLDLCKRIPEGCFEESALVWIDYGLGPEVEPRIVSDSFHPQSIMAAPTLAEILAELPVGTSVMMDAPGVWAIIAGAGTMEIKIEKDGNPAAAALRMWIKGKGIEL